MGAIGKKGDERPNIVVADCHKCGLSDGVRGEWDGRSYSTWLGKEHKAIPTECMKCGTREIILIPPESEDGDSD